MIDWYENINKEIEKPYFKELIDFVNKERETKNIYPRKGAVLDYLEFCNLDNIEIVIINVEPYPYAESRGYCFDSEYLITETTKKIYSTIAKEVYNKIITDEYFSTLNLAKQNILLLNIIQTVERDKPFSHKDKGWEKFSANILKTINEKDNVFYLFIGKNIHIYSTYITNKTAKIFRLEHPDRAILENRQWNTQNCFKAITEYRKENNLRTIKWFDEQKF